jgi:replicative DNA helicase
MPRETPYSADAERSVLGSVLISPAAYSDIAAELVIDDFYLPPHREVFDAMAKVAARSRPIDVLSVADEMQAALSLQRLEGGVGFLTALAAGVPTVENAPHYTRIVREKSRLRRLIGYCAEIQDSAYGATEAGDLLEKMSTHLAKLVTGGGAELVPIGALVAGVMDGIERREASGQIVSGVRTGITKLDELTCGFQDENLIIIAADTGGGKTALVCQSALDLVLRGGGTCLNFNLEMSRRELVERALAYLAEVNSHALRTGRIDKEQFSHLYTAAQKLLRAKYYLVDDAFSIRDITARARRWRAKHPTEQGMVIVDFIQLVETEIARGDVRARAVGLVAQGLKRLAKSLKVPVVVLSQFNRKPGTEDRRPTRADLKESSDLEQAADLIIIVHNPQRTEDGEVELIVDKSRHGMCRIIRAHWTGCHYRFRDPQFQEGGHG